MFKNLITQHSLSRVVYQNICWE